MLRSNKWLQRGRRQCQANVEAWLTHYDCPPAAVTEARIDRCLLEHSAPFVEHIEAKLDPWRIAIEDHKPKGGETVSARRGWREPVATYSAQLIEHELAGDRFVEIDFDPHNPNWGVALVIAHGFDWVKERITGTRVNPFKVRKALDKRGVEAPLVA